MTLRLRLRSTLFPYTTLFRSERDVRAHAVELEEEAVRPHVRVERAEEPEDRREVDGDQLVPFLVGQRQGDRKSTRLNSSHVAISYAVFCLKKKRIRKNEDDIQ